MVAGQQLSHIQVPTTLPTNDKLIGRKCTPKICNDDLLNMIRPDCLNVLTIHAEAEGISCPSLFQDFLAKARQRYMVFSPLGDLLPRAGKIEESGLNKGEVAGRNGWLAYQGDAASNSYS